MAKQNTFFKIVVVSICISALMGGFLYYYFHQNFLDFSLVSSTKINSKQIHASDYPWISIIDENFNPFYDEQYLQNTYGPCVNQMLKAIDKDKYSYIVTIGKELERIAFVRSEARTKVLGVIPKQYIGKVQLSSQQTNRIYLYQIKKINLVHDQYDLDYFLS